MNYLNELRKKLKIEPHYYCSYHDCFCPLEDLGKFNSECPKQAITQECNARSHEKVYKISQMTDKLTLQLIKILSVYDLQVWLHRGAWYIKAEDLFGAAIKDTLEEALCQFIAFAWEDFSQEVKDQILEVLK